MQPPTRIWLRLPASVIALAALALLTPQTVLLVWTMTALHVPLRDLASAFGPAFAFKVAAVASLALWHDPVDVDADEIRYAWCFRVRWDDVLEARVRRIYGFRTLELVRRRGWAWRILLGGSDHLLALLASRAPVGSPARLQLEAARSPE